MTGALPGLPGLLSTLSEGTAAVVVEPVHSARQAAELDLVLWRIRGVRGVELRELDGGAATFEVDLGRPVALASDLRVLFGRDLVECRREDGGLRVRLAAPPVAREDAAVAVDASPLTGRWEPREAGDASSLLPEPDDETAPPPVPLGAPLRLGDPATLAAALDDDPTTLVLLVDHDLVLRAVHGGLASPFAEGAAPVSGARLAEVAPPHRNLGLADRALAVLRGASTSLSWSTSSAGRVHEVVLRPVLRDGRVLGCRLTVADVTGRHDDRELLRDLTEVFEVGFREAPAGQALLSPDGSVLRSNPALHRLLGRGADELRGRAVGELLEPGDAAREDELRRETAAGERERFVVDLDPRVAAPSGFGVRAHVAAIVAPDGEVRGFWAHFETTGPLEDELVAQVVDGPW